MPLPAQDVGRRWRNQSLLREVDTHRARSVWLFLLVAAFAVAPFVAYLVQVHRYVETAYATQELRRAHDRLLEAERRLRIEHAMLQSLPTVEKRASSELQLARPAPTDVIVVKGAPGASTPSRAPDRTVGTR